MELERISKSNAGSPPRRRSQNNCGRSGRGPHPLGTRYSSFPYSIVYFAINALPVCKRTSEKDSFKISQKYTLPYFGPPMSSKTKKAGGWLAFSFYFPLDTAGRKKRHSIPQDFRVYSFVSSGWDSSRLVLVRLFQLFQGGASMPILEFGAAHLLIDERTGASLWSLSICSLNSCSVFLIATAHQLLNFLVDFRGDFLRIVLHVAHIPCR